MAAAQADLMETLSGALRGAIVASPGTQLYVADYNAIEARVLLWLADDQAALQTFRTGQDIYCEMASEIYHYPVTKGMPERALGKVAILGLGYQMGAPKFLDTAAKFGITIDEQLAEETVRAYRAKFWRVKELWCGQEEAAVQAVRASKRGEHYNSYPCGDVIWQKAGQFLYCQLPSGRKLAYPFPEIRKRLTPWGDEKASLTFMGINSYSRKWERQHTYGGSLVENIVQAVARDVMAAALLRLERGRVYLPVLSVHDEIIAEGPPTGSVEQFVQLITALPEWAEGLPIEAEGWTGTRYHK